ncbi:hypothetical protein IV203_020738 [Nitzschia inconspicua]|uniref:Uncharacterized protein n=1 Tax=Nitzschia inconspicua TaxID=303405 RepID=A0A9K3P8Q2_9STRA|nr:hypothetical protein IV203_021570 [Nitzschia inconspicua]KAG7342794.1 hypothetical protein IV203_020738 [Nitzschia inconspicua]
MSNRRRPKVEQPSSDEEDDEDVLSRLRNLQMSSGLGVSAIQHRNNNREKKNRNENVSTIKNDEPPLSLPSDDVEALLNPTRLKYYSDETLQGFLWCWSKGHQINPRRLGQKGIKSYC